MCHVKWTCLHDTGNLKVTTAEAIVYVFDWIGRLGLIIGLTFDMMLRLTWSLIVFNKAHLTFCSLMTCDFGVATVINTRLGATGRR